MFKIILLRSSCIPCCLQLLKVESDRECYSKLPFNLSLMVPPSPHYIPATILEAGLYVYQGGHKDIQTYKYK